MPSDSFGTIRAVRTMHQALWGNLHCSYYLTTEVLVAILAQQ